MPLIRGSLIQVVGLLWEFIMSRLPNDCPEKRGSRLIVKRDDHWCCRQFRPPISGLTLGWPCVGNGPIWGQFITSGLIEFVLGIRVLAGRDGFGIDVRPLVKVLPVDFIIVTVDSRKLLGECWRRERIRAGTRPGTRTTTARRTGSGKQRGRDHFILQPQSWIWILKNKLVMWNFCSIRCTSTLWEIDEKVTRKSFEHSQLETLVTQKDSDSKTRDSWLETRKGIQLFQVECRVQTCLDFTHL